MSYINGIKIHLCTFYFHLNVNNVRDTSKSTNKFTAPSSYFV